MLTSSRGGIDPDLVHDTETRIRWRSGAHRLTPGVRHGGENGRRDHTNASTAHVDSVAGRRLLVGERREVGGHGGGVDTRRRHATDDRDVDVDVDRAGRQCDGP